jgi:hypothetical protein
LGGGVTSTQLDWQDNLDHCSSVGDQSGQNGPTNLLKYEGWWKPLAKPKEAGTQEHWVVFDMGENYFIDDFEMVAPPDCPTRPKECTLQFLTGAGQWWSAAKWVGDVCKQTETVEVGNKY